MATNKITVKVWDWLVRIGHWTLVLAFFTAYLTEDDFLTLHAWAGYVVGIYLCLRILWGFIGSQHARFRDFVYSPTKIIGYLRTLAAGKPQHYIGHNPAGGAMVLALLTSLIITTYTGLKLYAVEKNKGPLAFIEQNVGQIVSVISPITDAKAESDDDDFEETGDDNDNDEDIQGINNDDEQDKSGEVNEEEEEFWEKLHEFFANFTLILVLIHVSGVVISSRIDKENLVKTMITGNKEIDDSYH